MTEFVTRLLALLTITADVLLIAALTVLWLTRGRREDRGWNDVRDLVSPYALPLAWVVALTATLGSLYYSEVANFIPCKLCWYQRIAMYPLALILGIAAWKRDLAIRRYVIPMAVMGGAISIYHYTIERFPDLAGSACDPAAPCTFVWVWQFHFISIPFQALTGFALVTALMFLMPRPGDDQRSEAAEADSRTAEYISS